jgi:hypothetical protein
MGEHKGVEFHPLSCAERLRLRGLLAAGDPPHPPTGLLHELARAIHTCCGHSRFKAHRLAWGFTVEAAVAGFHTMCHTVADTRRGLTVRSCLEWEAGGVPNRDYQTLLSRMFLANPVRLGFAVDYSPQSSVLVPPIPPPGDRIRLDAGTQHAAATVDARAAARFVRQIVAGAVNPLILEQCDADIRRLARAYISVPLFDLFLEIRTLRSGVFDLINANRYPGQLRDLHLAGSRLCGLQAHVCLDLGHYQQADDLARTAWLCADLADHPGMRGWVRGLQSLIAYWDRRPAAAVDLAADGVSHVTDGSIAVRLAALQARAAAACGDHRGALAALEAADTARHRLRVDDETGGVFTFPDAKQAAYAGTTLLTLDHRDLAGRAVNQSQRAIDLYEAATPAATPAATCSPRT